MSTIAIATARPTRRPRHLDLRAVLGFFLLLVAVGGSITFWSSSSTTTAVVVATRDLPAGATISAGDLAVARVRVDGIMYQAAVPAGALDAVIGKQLAAPVYAHQLLVQAQISSRLPIGPQQMALTIPVSADTAAGGRIRPGDSVEVLLTTGRGTPVVRTAVVLPRVPVYDIGYGAGPTVISSGAAANSTQGPISWVTLVVTQRQAVQLARAKWAGAIDVALLPGP